MIYRNAQSDSGNHENVNFIQPAKTIVYSGVFENKEQSNFNEQSNMNILWALNLSKTGKNR